MHREPLSTEAARRQVRRGGRPVVRQVAGGSLPPLRQERVRTGPVRGRPGGTAGRVQRVGRGWGVRPLHGLPAGASWLQRLAT